MINDFNPELWNSTKKEAVEGDKEFKPIPDGKYRVRILGCGLRKSQTNRDMVAWNMKIQEGKHAGRHLFTNHFFDSKESVLWLQRALIRCQVEIPETAAQLVETLEHLVGRFLEVTKKTTPKGYENIYFHSVYNPETVTHVVTAKQAGINENELPF